MLIRLTLSIIIFLTACQERIIHDLNELDANKIISKLYQAEIESKKEKQADGLWSISVPQLQVVPAIQLIEDYRIFRKPDVFAPQSKLLSSDQEEKLIYENSLARQLEITLQSLTGVLEAHVHFNINTEITIWKKANTPNKDSTAGVLLIVSTEFIFTSEELKQLVGGASGIEQDKINIVISYPALVNYSNLKLESKIVAKNHNTSFKAIDNKMEIQLYKILKSKWIGDICLFTLVLLIPYVIWKQRQAKKIEKFKAEVTLSS